MSALVIVVLNPVVWNHLAPLAFNSAGPRGTPFPKPSPPPRPPVPTFLSTQHSAEVFWTEERDQNWKTVQEKAQRLQPSQGTKVRPFHFGAQDCRCPSAPLESASCITYFHLSCHLTNHCSQSLWVGDCGHSATIGGFVCCKTPQDAHEQANS